MNYSELTRRYFQAPSGVGELSGPGIFRGVAGTFEQGTRVQFDLQIRAGTVQTVRFLAFGCPHTIAVCAWLAEQASGRALISTLPESVQALCDRFAVPVPKLGRLLIVEDAWVAATAAAIDGSKLRVKEP